MRARVVFVLSKKIRRNAIKSKGSCARPSIAQANARPKGTIALWTIEHKSRAHRYCIAAILGTISRMQSLNRIQQAVIVYIVSLCLVCVSVESLKCGCASIRNWFSTIQINVLKQAGETSKKQIKYIYGFSLKALIWSGAKSYAN